MDVSAPASATTRQIPLNRRVAVLRPGRIDIKPSRGALLGPLSGLLIGISSGLLIWFGLGTLPLWLLAILLILAITLIPLSGLGFVYALVGAHVVVDEAKQSITWQQGFLGMGVGTTELAPFWKVDKVIVEESGTEDDARRPVEEFAQWRIVILKKSGRRLDLGVVIVPRPLNAEGYARARDLAETVALMSGAVLSVPDEMEPPVPEAEPAAAPATGAAPTPARASSRPRAKRGARAARGRRA